MGHFDGVLDYFGNLTRMPEPISGKVWYIAAASPFFLGLAFFYLAVWDAVRGEELGQLLREIGIGAAFLAVGWIALRALHRRYPSEGATE